MSEIFNQLELNMVARSVEWYFKHDIAKYIQICDLLKRQGVNYTFDGRTCIIDNNKKDDQ